MIKGKHPVGNKVAFRCDCIIGKNAMLSKIAHVRTPGSNSGGLSVNLHGTRLHDRRNAFLIIRVQDDARIHKHTHTHKSFQGPNGWGERVKGTLIFKKIPNTKLLRHDDAGGIPLY